ncbi:hypothetical protein [Actinoplanes sp. NPDC049681]|uniref:hypothetical protein n=1 Tax=Actinoplanes sp. NPDC049681 TaxID=3363905 RepID=UPI0037A2EC0C
MTMIARALRAWALAAALLMSGCSMTDDGGRDHNPAHQPGYALPEHRGSSPSPIPTWPGSGTGLGLPGVGQAAPSDPDNVVRGGAGYSTQPHTFQLVDGSDVVRVSVADLGGELFHVATPGDSKVTPAVDADGTSVTARLRDTRRDGPAIVTVVLSRDVRWQVRLAGGASDEAVDLTGGSNGGDVELTAGTSKAELSLPAASGTERISVSSGASQLLVHLAGSAPVRVAIRDGAGDVTIDGQTHAGVAAGTVFSPPTWDAAKDRFDLDASSGVSELTVSRN